MQPPLVTSYIPKPIAQKAVDTVLDPAPILLGICCVTLGDGHAAGDLVIKQGFKQVIRERRAFVHLVEKSVPQRLHGQVDGAAV